MCSPLAIAGIAAATAAVSTVSEIQVANKQAASINQQNTVRKREIDQAATAEINDRLREARREQGRIMVAAGEAGLSLQSGSVEALLMDSATQAGLANARSLANRESRKKAADAEAQAMMPSSPSLLGAGLRIAAAGGSAYVNAKKSGK